MADAVTIADLRRLINEADDVEPWTDVYLSSRIDLWTGTINGLAATIWREKAAEYSELVDIQEGSSNRKLSQMYAQALKMAEGLDAGDVIVATGRRASRTRKIERM
jgi:hypothetical protein